MDLISVRNSSCLLYLMVMGSINLNSYICNDRKNIVGVYTMTVPVLVGHLLLKHAEQRLESAF